MIELLTTEIEALRRQGKDASLALAERAEKLLDTIGGLGASLADCDEVLISQMAKPKARIKVLPIRALIFSFLGADELANKDLEEIERLKLENEKLAQEYEAAREETKAVLNAYEDCPAAFVCNAADWHRTRRFAMLRRRPEIKNMYESKSDIFVTCGLMFTLILIHLACAWCSKDSAWTAIILAVTIGSICAYGFQALTHELGHMAFHCGGAKNNQLAFITASLGSSFCNFPWHYYYWNYHNRHHAHAGGERDRDGDILFRAWHCPPTISRYGIFFDMGAGTIRRFMWTGIFGMMIYPMFCRAKLILDAPHMPSLKYEGWNLATYALVGFVFGRYGLLFVFASAAFSLGAFGHPFLQFWLTQHAFVFGRKSRFERVNALANDFYLPLLQPTCSSSLSTWVWHAFNFGELRHVEHHDFPFIPYLRAFKLPKLCPEFYSSLEPALPAMHALYDWLSHAGHLQYAWMAAKGDFAGRGYHLAKLWRLMQELDDGMAEEEEDNNCEDGQEEEGKDVGDMEYEDEVEEEEQRPWSPSEDVDDEDAFVKAPTVAFDTMNIPNN